MNEVVTIIGIIVGGLFVSFMRGRKKAGAASELKPPKNTASEVAIDNVQESLKEELDRIKTATDGDSPADDLADLGNARKRR
jgi:5,10-methylenetetrahydrofolate reductase